MQIISDVKSEDILRIEYLLEGCNYTVWVNIYGPLDVEQSLEAVLHNSISQDCVVGGATFVSVDEVRNEVLASLLHPGDGGYGPVELENKRLEILSLIEKLFKFVNIEQAESISAFWLTKGHPAYPVFWDFSFDIHTRDERWIFMGSSSD